jgi:glycosyltransferase involved in cell wall biosynthesis
MKEVTFIIPIRVDSDDRIQNFNAVLAYLDRFFRESEIIVIEDDKEKRIGAQLEQYPGLKYIHIENPDRFSKSRAVNAGLLQTTGKYTIIHDADVLVHPAAIKKCIRIMERGFKHVMVPYNSVVINIAGASKNELIRTLDISAIGYVHRGIEKPVNNEHSYAIHAAGISIVNTVILRSFGGFNKKMISYGYEDVEIYTRLRKMGFYHFMTGGYNLLHLDHHRGTDSKINELYLENRKEFEKVKKMSFSTLLKYIYEELTITSLNQKEIKKILTRQRILNLLLLQPLHFYLRQVTGYITHNQLGNTLAKVINPKLRRRNKYV